MTRRLAWLSILLTLVPPAGAMAAERLARPNRLHVGRVKSVDPRGDRLVVEGMFHDRSFREIPVRLEPGTPVINPDMVNRARVARREEIRPGDYVALECEESEGRHTARKVTITSTEEEERLQRAFGKGRRVPPRGMRGTGGDLR